jgi:hypothetical protein
MNDVHTRAGSRNSFRVDADWPAVIDTATELLAFGGIIEPASSTFELACEQADSEKSVVSEPERLRRLRRLMADNASLERAYYELVENRPTPQTTVEALILGLRERGAAALNEPAVRQRLFALDDQQLREVCGRLQRSKPEIARPWSADEVEALISVRETF